MANRLKRKHRFHRPAPGAPPGTLQTDPEAPRPIISVLAYSPQGFVEETIQHPQQIGKFLKEWPITWVNVSGLGDVAVIRSIGEIFHLHPLELEDVVHVHQRAKVDHYGDHHYVVCHEVSLTPALDSDQISLFFGTNYVLTFQEKAGDCLDPVRNRIRQGLGQIRRLGTDHLMYALIDAVVDHYFPVLERIGERVDDLEEKIITQPANAWMSDILRLKRELLALRRTLWPHRDSLNVLIRDPIPLITDETRIYLRDCYDHVVRLLDLLETYRELGSDLVDLQLSTVSNRTNEVMQLLTVIATIFIPLTFITGLYGMNFDTKISPWNMPELEWPYGYPAVLTVMAALSVGLLGYFWRKGWLGGE